MEKREKIFLMFNLLSLVLIFFLFSATVVVLAFSSPTQNPPLGEVSYWRKNGTNLYFNSGSVGIGTASPSYKLHVSGDILASSIRAATGICIGSSCRTSFPSVVPSGMVLFFNLPSCPSGWTELTSARGRYIVGLPAGGTLAATVGTALSNQENRPVGQHTHTVNDPGHDHYITHRPSIGLAGTDLESGSSFNFSIGDSYVSDTGVILNNAGTVAGTNAPYIQLLVCQKN
ncbi:MAG: hypothetical protein N2Z68_01385 [Patescibacteria group bacterium]|nr:hypothetical protein [Patescibacteria group bacterium]